MKTDGRFDTAGLEENEYEHGSNNSILKNLCGITTVAGMEQAETLALVETLIRGMTRRSPPVLGSGPVVV